MTSDKTLKKKHWLKNPKAVPPKTKLDQNLSDSESHIWNSFFEDIISGMQLYNIRPHVPVDIIRVFFNFRFSSRKSQSQQKLEKRSLILQYSFAQKTSFILRTSTHLTSKLIWSRNTVKNLSAFTNFPANMFLFDVRKSICTAPFLDAQELFLKHFESKCLYISVYLRKKIFVPETQERFYMVTGGLGEAE